MRAFSILPSLILGSIFALPASAQPAAMAMDVPVTRNGIESVCTGVSLNTRENPRWSQYALKVEIAGSGGRYLGDENVTLRRNGADLLSLSCGGPWILFQLPPGRYEVTAELAGATVSSPAFVSAGGQGRIILRFPDKENTAYPMNYSDEAAQTLGIRNGRMDAFTVPPAPGDRLMPLVRGGVNKKGASLDLQWKTN